MKLMTILFAFALTAVLRCAPALADASPAVVEPESAAASESEPEPGFALVADIGFASAFVWRGYNIFQTSDQMDQNTMLAPSLTLSLPIEGLSIGYWGAYQLNGDGRSALIDAGLGAEQDLILGYERSFGEQLTGSFALTYYFYPLADENVAGTSVPSYVEPSASVSYSDAAEFGLAVAYFYGVQDAVAGIRHLYLNPSVSKSFAVNDDLGVDAKLGFGYKLFDDSDVNENVYDVLISVAVPIAATESVEVVPSLNAAWTNLSGKGFGDEYVVWAGVNVGLPVF